MCDQTAKILVAMDDQKKEDRPMTATEVLRRREEYRRGETTTNPLLAPFVDRALAVLRKHGLLS